MRVALNSHDRRIAPDMDAQVSFLARQRSQATSPPGVLAPAAAITRHDGRALAFVVVDAGSVEARPLTLGDSDGDSRRVLSGLAPGDRVVLDPPPRLRAGQHIREHDDEENAAR